MWISKCLRFAVAVGASCAAGSDVVCVQGPCPCGKCAFPGKDGTQCYWGPFSYTQAPTRKDTGGTCRWLSCSSSRGPQGSYRCSQDYKCMCNDGYFANQAGVCTQTQLAQCWAEGNSCVEVYHQCRDQCDFTKPRDHYTQQIQGIVVSDDHLERDAQMHQMSSPFDKTVDGEPCAACLMTYDLEFKMRSCLGCVNACSNDYQVELAETPPAANLTEARSPAMTAEIGDAPKTGAAAAMGLILGGVATALAARACSRDQDMPALPDSLLG